MKPLPHVYEVRLTGGPASYAKRFRRQLVRSTDGASPRFRRPRTRVESRVTGDRHALHHCPAAMVPSRFLHATEVALAGNSAQKRRRLRNGTFAGLVKNFERPRFLKQMDGPGEDSYRPFKDGGPGTFRWCGTGHLDGAD